MIFRRFRLFDRYGIRLIDRYEDMYRYMTISKMVARPLPGYEYLRSKFR